MAEENLFEGLPPPSTAARTTPSSPPLDAEKKDPPPEPPAPRPALKSALKREKPADPNPEAGEKRLRFKTTTDATEAQVIEAMQKISSHIKNPSKFSKASKLALQLIQAGSVKNGTSDYFFAMLEAAMSSSVSCTDPALRADYQALFSAAEDVKEFFDKQQTNWLATWTMKAVIANDLYTDDSFVFSRAAGKIKEAISSLPLATAKDDAEEAESLANSVDDAMTTGSQETSNSKSSLLKQNEEASDPFGLDALLSDSSKKDECAVAKKAEIEETKRFLKSQREVLTLCLEIAGQRYKIPWAQTVIDILAKHAFDNVGRFTSRQRDAIEKLWNSIKEQQIRRKQGKSVTGKLDMNAFEWLQEKYANEKISIRHAVGGGGDRRAEQWLG